jgi:phosphohistidine phosphatase
MRLLTLVRHARAESAVDGNDFERPLSDQGQYQAIMMSQRFAEQGRRPDLIVCSGAKRALSTAAVFASATGYPQQDITVLPEVYSGYDSTLTNLLQGQSDQHKHLILVGHNPALSELGHFLTGEVQHMPPCSVLCLQLPITQWCELAESCGTTAHYDTP